MLTWDVRPGGGVGPIEFGMTSSDVQRILGKPEFCDNPEVPLGGPYPADERVTEFRMFDYSNEKYQPDVSFFSNRVVSLDVYTLHETLKLQDVALFKNTPTVLADILKGMSKSYAFDDTSYIFLDLSIALSLETWEISKSVTIFAVGEFDEFVEDGVEDGTVTWVRDRQLYRRRGDADL